MKSSLWVQSLNEKYGDLLFDFSQSMLWNPLIAPEAYRAIFRRLSRYKNKAHYVKYERPWVLSIALKVLQKYTWKNPVKITPSEQVMLDSNPSPKARLRHFDSYFHRLPFLSQVALLLRFKYNLPLEEIGATLDLPAPSLSLRIDQAIRRLQEWIWGDESIDTQATQEKKIIELLSDQPHSIRTDELRENPMHNRWRRPKLNRDWKKVWIDLPAPIKLSIESLGIVAVIFGSIHFAPLVREIYERKMDERLQGLIETNDGRLSIPLQRGRTEGSTDLSIADSEYSGGDETTEAESDHDEIKVGRSEIWRFNVKTDSPAQMRTKIIQSFQNLGLPQDTPGLGGVEAPGGIQFDILVPQSAVAGIKQELERHLPSLDESGNNYNDLFTWYKNRSKKPIPSGYSRVVIWLSQI
jgi:DNA-directed RNA polymerase specialized sigma24 family protein